MDTTNCPAGLFTDLSFEVSDTICDESVRALWACIGVLIVIRSFVSVQSIRMWISMHTKRTIRRSEKARYCLQRRLPITPVTMTVASISSILTWMLLALNVVNLPNGLSLVLVGFFYAAHMIPATLLFLRFVRMGLTIIPLVSRMDRRSLRGLSSPSSTYNLPVRQRSMDEDSVVSIVRDGSIDLETGPRTTANSTTDATSVVLSKLVVSTGAYSRERFQSSQSDIQGPATEPSHDASAGSLGRHESNGVNQYHVRIAQNDTNRFDPTLKFLFTLRCGCLITGLLSALILGPVLPNKDMVLTLTMFCFATNHVMEAWLYFWQLHRNITAVKELCNKSKSTSPLLTDADLEKVVTALNRQRIVAVVANLCYTGICFYVGIAATARPWWIFAIMDSVAAIQFLVLVLLQLRKEWLDKRARRKAARNEASKAAKKGDRTHVKAQRGNGKGNNAHSVAAVSSENGGDIMPQVLSPSSHGGPASPRSQYSSSAADDNFPTYDEAWQQGFKWRRWSFGPEKERKAFIIEYKNWLKQQRPQDKKAAAA